MARFTTIDDKALKDLKFDELKTFFMEHIFFRFMDSGRSGIASAARDLIDTMMDWQVAHNPSLAKLSISDADYQSIKDYAIKNLVDDFIREGTQGWNGTIVSVGMYIANSRK